MAPDKIKTEYRIDDPCPGELEDEDPEIIEYEMKHRVILVQDILKQEVPF